MKMLLILAGVLLASCNNSKKAGNSTGGSNDGPTVPLPTVSIATDLKNITFTNAATFTVSGTCSEEGQLVTVIVENLSPATAPTCTDGAWMAEIDLSSLIGTSREVFITADHASSGGQNATQATGSALLLHLMVTIATNLENITSTNVVSFTVSGGCSEEGQPVTVSVEGLSPTTAPICTNGAWVAEIDLSSLSGASREISITADHASSGGQAVPQATGSILLYPMVTIATNLENITSTNAATFTVSGTCSEEGQPVTVSVESLSPATAPVCTSSGTWSVIVDVTSLSGTARGLSITANHSTSNGLAAIQATGDAFVPPIVTVSTALADITATNANAFTVSGTCSENGRPVTVVVGEGEGDVNLAIAPTCTSSGTWSMTVDVTRLNKIAEVSVTASQVSLDGKASAEATESVTNEFICPQNYVGVPPLLDYTTNSFCVMKYEAKNDSGSSASQASGTPHVRINRSNSITKCAAIGEGYDLITNDEWQTLARNIELVSGNWATGAIGNSGGLSRGHSDNAPNNPLAANSNDNEGCHGTGQTCNSTLWHHQRRTHTLSNGEVIWDIAGNVREWVKDNNDGSRYDSAAYISQVTAVSHSTLNSLSNGTTEIERNAKDQFGPSGDYESLNTIPYGNLGYGFVNANVGGVVRSGNWREGPVAGVFAINLSLTSTGTYTDIGYRCVLHP